MPATTSHRRTLPLWALVASGLVLASCGGDSGSPAAPENGNGPEGPGTPPTVLPDPPFSSVIAPIFEERGCTASSCHGIPNQADLRLLADTAWLELVNVQAVMEPQEVLVIPGDPLNSYLVKKIEGRHTEGNRMPPNRDTLSTVQQTNIRNWIAEGAKRN